jgi:hypothetical protein
MVIKLAAGRAAWRGRLLWTMPLVGLVALVLALHGASQWRLERLAARPLLPTKFAHADHRGVNCTTCHHNFVGQRLGGRRCLACHKALTRDAGLRIDTLFHEFCTSCHRVERAALRASGPVKACASCHVPSRSRTFRIQRLEGP